MVPSENTAIWIKFLSKLVVLVLSPLLFWTLVILTPHQHRHTPRDSLHSKYWPPRPRWIWTSGGHCSPTTTKSIQTTYVKWLTFTSLQKSCHQICNLLVPVQFHNAQTRNTLRRDQKTSVILRRSENFCRVSQEEERKNTFVSK